MHLLRTVIAGLAVGTLGLLPVQAATGNLIGTGGAARGTVTVTAAPKGVILRVGATGLSPGWHGMHFHEKGDCSGRVTPASGIGSPPLPTTRTFNVTAVGSAS